MSTTMTRRSTKSVSSQGSVGPNASVFSAAIMDFEVKIYGSGSKPLYDLVSRYGGIESLNSLDSAFQSFQEVKDELKVGEAGFCYSSEYNQFTMAIRIPGGGIVFVGLLHDKDGAPIVDEPFALCRVKANRDFEVDGEVIVREGSEFLKALPESYVNKMKKAA